MDQTKARDQAAQATARTQQVNTQIFVQVIQAQARDHASQATVIAQQAGAQAQVQTASARDNAATLVQVQQNHALLNQARLDRKPVRTMIGLQQGNLRPAPRPTPQRLNGTCSPNKVFPTCLPDS